MTRSDRNKPTKGTKPAKTEGNQTSIAGARDKLASLVHQAEDGAAVEITRRGRPVAVLLSYHEYQRLLGEGPSFWDAMMAWRNSSHVDDAQHVLGIEPDTFPRDKTPGRPSPFES
jgi:prevent-host-death family protein